MNDSRNLGDLPTSLDLLLREDSQQNHIITFCSEIDDMLSGGVSLNKITEFCGVPGIGKTQIAFQLLVNTCIPKEYHGVGGKAIYIDTEGSFSCERVREIAEHVCSHLRRIRETEGEAGEDGEVLTVSTVMDSIYYYRVYHYVELIALVNSLFTFLESAPDVRLIVVDSIAYPFRRDFSDISVRTRSLLPLAQNLSQMAEKFNLAVVLLNQVTTKISKENSSSTSTTNQPSILIPSLGESWAHVCPYRLILYWKDKFRFCHLYKSPTFRSLDQPFVINECGVRSFEAASEDQDSSVNNIEIEEVNFDEPKE